MWIRHDPVNPDEATCPSILSEDRWLISQARSDVPHVARRLLIVIVDRDRSNGSDYASHLRALNILKNRFLILENPLKFIKNSEKF